MTITYKILGKETTQAAILETLKNSAPKKNSAPTYKIVEIETIHHGKYRAEFRQIDQSTILCMIVNDRNMIVNRHYYSINMISKDSIKSLAYIKMQTRTIVDGKERLFKIWRSKIKCHAHMLFHANLTDRERTKFRNMIDNLEDRAEALSFSL